MTTEAAPPGSGLFYGWFVVAAAFTITFIGFGSAYTFSAFLEPLQADFGASRGSVSLVFSLAGFLYFGLGIVSGSLADRWGTRRLVILGMLLTGAGLAAASVANSLEVVYVAYGLGIGLGIGCAYVPTLGAVQRWFVRRRGLASGIASSGIGVGTLVMPPAASYLIAAFGWRDAYLLLGGFAAIAGAGVALVLVSHPRDRGLAPDGDQPQEDIRSAPLTGLTVSQAMRTRSFTVLYLSSLIASFGVFVPFVHLVPYAQDHGIPKATAVLLLGMIGIGSTAGRFMLGGIADRLGRRNAPIIMFLGMALALAIWFGSSTFWPLAVSALLFGIFYGGWVAVLPAVVMDHFGGRHISSIIGVLYTSFSIGTLVGPTAAGMAFDINHSYTVPILVCVVTNVIAAIIAAFDAGKDVSGSRA